MKKDDGFTLVEMIVTIVILGILSAVTIVGFSAYMNMNTENILEAMSTSLAEARYEAVLNDGKEVHITFDVQGNNYIATIYENNSIFKESVVGSTRTDIYSTDNSSFSYSGVYYPVTQMYNLDYFMKYANHKGGSTDVNSMIYTIAEKSVTFYFNNDGSIVDIARGGEKLPHTLGTKDTNDTRLRNFEIVGLTGKQNGGQTLTVSIDTGKAFIEDFTFGAKDISQQKSYGVLHSDSEK